MADVLPLTPWKPGVESLAWQRLGPVPSKSVLVDNDRDDGAAFRQVSNMEKFYAWVERAAFKRCLTDQETHSPLPCVDCLAEAELYAHHHAPSELD